MKTNREEIVELFNIILQLCVFIGVCNLITNNIKQSIVFGICYLFILVEIRKNLKK